MESHHQPIPKKKKFILRSFRWRNEKGKEASLEERGDRNREFRCRNCVPKGSYLSDLSFSRCIWHIIEMLQRPCHKTSLLRVSACCAQAATLPLNDAPARSSLKRKNKKVADSSVLPSTTCHRVCDWQSLVQLFQGAQSGYLH